MVARGGDAVSARDVPIGGALRGMKVGAAARWAAHLIQQAWRSMRQDRSSRTGGERGRDRDRARERGPTMIERQWTGARAQKLGPLESHVRFLQGWVRGILSLRPSALRERERGLVRVPALVWSCFGQGQRRRTRCERGENLAGEKEFQAQKELSEAMLDWYSTYVALLRRLQSGVTPFSIQDFCGAGGSSEGCRRAGGASHGIDNQEQDDYCRRFGSECFTLGDGVSWARVARLRDRYNADVLIGGPPCKYYSRARVKGEATQPPLIDVFRDLCESLMGDRCWAIENVMGAAPHMSEGAAVLDGALFGLRVARARLYECNFRLHVDRAVDGPAERLRERCCLGRRRRFRRFDRFGRPEKEACCEGNIFALQVARPYPV